MSRRANGPMVLSRATTSKSTFVASAVCVPPVMLSTSADDVVRPVFWVPETWRLLPLGVWIFRTTVLGPVRQLPRRLSPFGAVPIDTRDDPWLRVVEKKVAPGPAGP